MKWSAKQLPLTMLIPGATIRREAIETKNEKRLAADGLNDTCTAASLFNYVDNTERWEAITLFSPTVPIPFVPR